LSTFLGNITILADAKLEISLGEDQSVKKFHVKGGTALFNKSVFYQGSANLRLDLVLDGGKGFSITQNFDPKTCSINL